MDWNQLMAVVVQLGIFAMFVTSIIEVIKGISAIGIKGIIADLWGALIHNQKMNDASFPILNFAVASICCWAFNVTIMSYIFHNILSLQLQASTPLQQWFAQRIDYFGTASVTYLGADQLFKKFLDVKTEAASLVNSEPPKQ